jgi:uncharacterized membrane protein
MPLLARTHPRLTAAATLGIAVGILAPADSIISKILFGWNAGVWTYLVLMFWLVVRAKAPDVKRIAEVEDENAGVVLFVVCIAAIASLATIAFEPVQYGDSRVLDQHRRRAVQLIRAQTF